MNERWHSTVWAYAAGLLDGEGTVGLTRRHKNTRRSPFVSVPSCTPQLLSWLWVRFGGCISTKRTYQKNHSPSGTWALGSDESLVFLRKVLPFMHEPEKIRRAELLVSEYKLVTPRNGKYTKQALKRKRDFEKRFFKNTRRRLALAL